MQSNRKKPNSAVLIIDSQPPHLGELLQLLSNLHKYDLICFCINGQEKVISHQHVLQIWHSILQPYAEKVSLMVFSYDFTQLDKDLIPEMLENCTFLTSDRQIFVHLSGIGLNAELIPRALGYHSIFFRAAFKQSKALDWLESKFINSITNINKKK